MTTPAEGRAASFKVSARGVRAHGTNNLDSLFPDSAPTTAIPLPGYNRRRGYDREAVKSTLSRMPEDHDFVDVDPRELSASQGSVTRSGVQHYMSDEYAKTGSTFADHDKVGNRHPIVYDRNDGSERVTLSGHHRAMAALVQGTTLRMRRVQGP